MRRGDQLDQGLQKLDFDQIDAITGPTFERYVGELLSARGFRNIRYTAASNDDGIDILATHDGQKYAIQTKRYTGTLRKGHIYPVHSAHASKKYACDKAMVVTNSYFTKHAREYAEMAGVILVDREELGWWRESVE
jgi:HJR/Mrr/RecB family endonuclease